MSSTFRGWFHVRLGDVLGDLSLGAVFSSESFKGPKNFLSVSSSNTFGPAKSVAGQRVKTSE